ncbi:MAG: adenosylmethionine--8-amino-7-oxononanoate transaminase [Bacteroidia bacterium]
MNWIEKDKATIWHPFTHLKYAKSPILIERADGIYYYDSEGNKYIDAISSWWVNLHGHNNPYINSKISEQLKSMEHVMFSDFTHKPAIELAERLVKILPDNQSKIFYSDNGSTSVEVAIKMVLQYCHNKGKSNKLFIAFENAYHGDTFGGMSVGARNVFNQAFENHLFNVAHIPLPTVENIDQIKSVIAEWHSNHELAGFIFEPIVQGAAGMVMYEPELLNDLIGFVKGLGVFTIADEVMTGFGRTGKSFASDYLSNKPDIICLSKGITGGYFPLGVTSCTEEIYNACLVDDKSKTFFHGHSYTANPLACSAALASLDLLEKKETQQQIDLIHDSHKNFKAKLGKNNNCKDIRVFGTILAIELNTDERTHYLNNASEDITRFFIERGILMRPLGNVFYVIPPYCIKENELNTIYKAIEEFLN